MKKIKLNDIRIDGNTQSRVVIDQPTVYTYRDHMNEGDEFPPLETVFDGATHWLVDGFHRYHAYKLMGIKEITINYTPGTLEEAQVRSFGVNGTHGKPRTNADKRKCVEAALIHPLLLDKSVYEIAKICHVSQPFVAAIKDPDAKQKQKASKEKNIQKKADELNTNQISTGKPLDDVPTTNQISSFSATDTGPDASELLANQKKHEADMELLGQFLDADDKMAHLYEENKKLAHQVAMKDLRINELLNEKSAAIKMVKDLQKQLDKLKAKK